MIDATVHYQGRDEQQQVFLVLPRAGELVDAHDHLWRVHTIVYGAMVNVFVVQVSAGLEADLRADWAAWGDAPMPAAQTTEQRELFG